MIIQMLFQISGGRYDDRPWPGPGIPFEVPDWEGNGLVKDGAAVFVSGTVARAPVKKAAEPESKSLPDATGSDSGSGTTEGGSEPELVPAVAELTQPASADPKATWVAYAVSRGASQAEADNLTKSQLQATYGGRL